MPEYACIVHLHVLHEQELSGVSLSIMGTTGPVEEQSRWVAGYR